MVYPSVASYLHTFRSPCATMDAPKEVLCDEDFVSE